MTREEIIAILESYKSFEDNRTENLLHHGYDNTKASRKRKEALDEAIKALSENKGDLIRRIEAESVLHNNLHALIDTDQLYQLYKDIDRLPAYSCSNSPENKGEWVEVVEKRFPNGEKQVWHYECSACGTGEPFTPINKEHWDFCPNCGADMRGGKE